MNDKYIHIWPDGTWCYNDELEGLLQGKSDDYVSIDTSLYSYDDPEELVQAYEHGFVRVS